jgi:hypothetical protein
MAWLRRVLKGKKRRRLGEAPTATATEKAICGYTLFIHLDWLHLAIVLLTNPGESTIVTTSPH